jgi:hypothetical protein
MGLIVRHRGKSVFARQPATEEERIAAWRAVLVSPTASIGTETPQPQLSRVSYGTAEVLDLEAQ